MNPYKRSFHHKRRLWSEKDEQIIRSCVDRLVNEGEKRHHLVDELARRFGISKCTMREKFNKVLKAQGVTA